MKKKGDGTYLKKNRKRYALCKVCHEEYNISVYAKLDRKKGYICPKCRGGKNESIV